MPTSNRVQGKININLASMGIIRSKSGASLDFGGVKRDAVTDDQGIAGYIEAHVAPKIDATIIKKAGVSLQALAAIVKEDVSFEGDDGSHHVLRDAWCSAPPTLAGGEIKITFIGTRCDEITA